MRQYRLSWHRTESKACNSEGFARKISWIFDVWNFIVWKLGVLLQRNTSKNIALTIELAFLSSSRSEHPPLQCVIHSHKHPRRVPKKKPQLSKSGAMIRTVGEQNKARRELFVGNYLRRDNNCDKDWSPELNYEIPWRSTYILITMTAFVSLVHTWGTGFLRTPALIKIAGWIASWRSLGSNSEAPTLEKDIQPENTSDWEGNYVDNY